MKVASCPPPFAFLHGNLLSKFVACPEVFPDETAPNSCLGVARMIMAVGEKEAS